MQAGLGCAVERGIAVLIARRLGMVVRQFPGRRSSVRASAGRRRRGASDVRKKWLGLRGVVVALGVCLACLSGCRIDAKVEFKADSHPSVSFS